MKTLNHFRLLIVAFFLANTALAQTNAPAMTNAMAIVTNAAPAHINTAIIPIPRPETNAMKRTMVVLQRAKDHPGDCDVVFIGDSITQNWEGPGKAVWAEYYTNRNCLNFGVGGDKTQHVLWRYEHGQLDGLKPKVAVIMIGTNNSNKNKDGTEECTEADILEGVQLIVKETRERLPDTKIILMGIFPRSANFSTQRGKILQVNEALAKLDDNAHIFYIDIGPQLIENDGTISKSMMRDALHPGEHGYQIWAAAIEPRLKELLAK